MPGLFGLLAKNEHDSNLLPGLSQQMIGAIRRVPWLKTETLFSENFCGGRVHLGVLNPQPQPLLLENQGMQIWFDGEIYPEIQVRDTTPSGKQIFQWIQDTTLLAQVDGVFACASFDPINQQLILINDRLGFRPLYYTETKNWFAYAAEVKALLAILPQIPELDEISLRQFFGFGYMLGERTWWQGIKVLPPGSLWRISAKEQRREQYWSFADLRYDPIPLVEAEQKFGELWTQSVRQHTKPGKTGFLLSGGLDSRALLAELCNQEYDVTAITFGEPGCSDIQIASQCASITYIPHRILHITPETWWQRREDAIWQTDGAINSIDLHAAIATEELRHGNCCNPMNLAGDLLFGGSYLHQDVIHDWKFNSWELMRSKYVDNPFWDSDEIKEISIRDIEEYCVGPSMDCFYLSQRVRRCTIYGPLLYAHYCETTYPSMTYPLLKLFLSGLSDEQRLHSKFYNHFLIDHYPAYFNDIPWQKTGRGLAESSLTSICRKFTSRVRRLLGKSSYSYGSFVDYSNKQYLDQVRYKLLQYGDLMIEAYFEGQITKMLSSGKSALNAKTILAILTLEVYLRQVYNMPGMLSR